MTEKNLDSLKNDVREIKEAILGTGLHDGHGLMQRQKRIEKRVSVIERVLWVAAGAFAIIQLIVKVIDYDSFFK